MHENDKRRTRRVNGMQKLLEQTYNKIKEDGLKMITKQLCKDCEHDIRFEDRPYGLLVAECKMRCEEYDPHDPVGCIKWRGRR